MGVANTGLPGRVAMPTPTMLPCCPCSACPGCPAQRPAHCPGYRSRRRPAPSPGPKGYCQPQPRTPNRGTWDSPLCINARSAPDYQKCAQTFRPMLKGLRFTPPWGSMGVKIFFKNYSAIYAMVAITKALAPAVATPVGGPKKERWKTPTTEG